MKLFLSVSGYMMIFEYISPLMHSYSLRCFSAHKFTLLAMLATCLIVFITLIAILLAFTLVDAESFTDGNDGNSSTEGAGSTTRGSGDPATTLSVPPELVIPTIAQMPATAATSPTAPTSPVTTRRSGLIFCVVGDSLTTPELFHRQLCDYIVYADMVATSPYADGFAPLHGPSSWDVFTRGALASTVATAGVSFSVNGLGQPESTLSALPNMDRHLADLVRSANLSAMGVLNFPRYTRINTYSLVPAYKAMTDVLRAERRVKPMTFIGAWLYEPVASAHFAVEVESIPHLNVIILQTHISKLYYAGDLCSTRPICRKGQTYLLPSFEVAERASSYLQLRGGNFSVMLSSTLGVMVYVGKPGAKTPTAADQECEYSYMVDSDFPCRSNISTRLQSYNSAEQYAYEAYTDGKRRFYLTYETVQSLQDKMDTYANVSTGWALFEAQRDVWKACGQDDYLRLSAIQQKARRLGKR
ncbi:uncharacterized protein [Dermacentor albipictus]|uniref:uncharacterized protein isoform X1 n=2 Tax=Dermacentor albipictus TaxID=60249 RepID=UPI0038FCB9D1